MPSFALTLLAPTLAAHGALPPATPYDRSLTAAARIDRLFARRDARQAFPAYVRSHAPTRVIAELRQAGFAYRDGRNGCRYVWGGPTRGPQHAFISFCDGKVRVEMGYSFF